ncbi:uncharacterized protein LOC124871715 isoform X3 [Girardinichthys multiradiatus]|uniref:uncharacterized protein LOC124871715 isoform X3 n=1 Tax=Girardinichthys multiradiatus TaxID=208333 RepID=UPI001FABAD55|nr:uncharacterized protein LOC124871715 isoform X3 [Girardinichthys multiradiatus]
MSLTPSYQGETASASPESPREGDFSSRQFYDNLKSLEEQETCDDKRDPIVNKAADNHSSSPLKAQICASLVTNDLENVCASISSEEQIEKRHQREPEDSSSSMQSSLTKFHGGLHTGCKIYYSVQKEVGDLQMLHDEMNIDSGPVYLKTEDDKTEEEYDIPCLGLPRLIAHRREPKHTLHISKLPELKSEKNPHLDPCDFCQKLCQPFTLSKVLKNETHFERVFYCEQAKQMRELIQKERENLDMKYSGRMIDVDIHTSISRQDWETAKEHQRGRVRHSQRQRIQRKCESSGWTLSKEIRYELSDAGSTVGTLTSQKETYAEPKIKDATQKFYKSGTCFLIMYSDGTGTIFYPSGKPAIVISSSEAPHLNYIILEDKDTAPSIKGIFTTKGYSTCYHTNGSIWLTLTSGGGLCFSEAGDLTRRWNWMYFDPHVRNLPFRPVTFALGPYISVRIHSQEYVYVTFVHKENHVRFKVGTELKFISPESHNKSGQSVLERYIQMRKIEIYSLIDQMQTCMSRSSANVHNIKPHYRFIARKEQLSKQAEKEKSPKKIKAHAN